MKTIIITIFLLLIAGQVCGAEYWLAEGGSAGSKEASSACNDAMSVAVHNGETFAAGDTIYLCDDGGTIDSEIVPPSSGTDNSNRITYGAASGETVIVQTATDSHHAFRSSQDWITLDCDLGGGSVTFRGDADIDTNCGGECIIMEFSSTTGTTISDCTIDGTTAAAEYSHTGPYYGIKFSNSSDDIIVSNNTIDGMSLSIYLYSTKGGSTTAPITGSIDNNVITDSILTYPTACGGCDAILINGSSAVTTNYSEMVVERNQILNFGDDGIDLNNSYGVTIRYNEIGNVTSATPGSDHVGIKLSLNGFNYGGFHKIYGNYFHDMDDTGNIAGIEGNHNSTGVRVWANYFVDTNKGVRPDNDGADDYRCESLCSAANTPYAACTGSGQTCSGKDDIYIFNNTIEDMDGRCIAMADTDYHDVYTYNNICDGPGNDDITVASGSDGNVYGGYNLLLGTVVNTGGGYTAESPDTTGTDPLINALSGTITVQSLAIDSGKYMGSVANASGGTGDYAWDYDLVLCPTSSVSNWVGTASLCKNAGSDGISDKGAFMLGKWGGD